MPYKTKNKRTFKKFGWVGKPCKSANGRLGGRAEGLGLKHCAPEAALTAGASATALRKKRKEKVCEETRKVCCVTQYIQCVTSGSGTVSG